MAYKIEELLSVSWLKGAGHYSDSKEVYSMVEKKKWKDLDLKVKFLSLYSEMVKMRYFYLRNGF